MDARNEGHADGVGAGHGDGCESAGISKRQAGHTAEEEPRANQEHRPRQAATRGEDAKAEEDLPQAWQHPENCRRDVEQDEGQNGAGNTCWKELSNRHEDHLVRHAGVKAVCPPEHLGCYECGAQSTGTEPKRNILNVVSCGFWKPTGLGDSGQYRQEGRRQKSGWTVAAELGSLRDLTANASNFEEGLIEVSHGC